VYGYLPRAVIQEVSLQTAISLSQIYGVASFYNQFRLQQAGKFIINVCQGTACHVAGAPLIADALSEELGLSVGETSRDRLFTLQKVSCVGACALAPVVRVNDDETHGKATPDSMRKLVADLRHRAEVDR
jgi:NADH-quinone oxidoreductase subunit E